MNSDRQVVAPLRIDAVLCDSERLALEGAAEELSRCLTAEGVSGFAIDVRHHSALLDSAPAAGPRLIVASLLREYFAAEESVSAIERRLRRDFSTLAKDGGSQVFLCTVFRRVDQKTGAVGSAAAYQGLERIRRLNLLAAQLSHDFDINIIDVDRSLAHIGGRVLDTDLTLRGSAAVSVVKDVIVSTLFAAGLDAFCSPELQEAAKARYEQSRTPVVRPVQHHVSASWLNYAQADPHKARQTYALALPRSRKLSDIWLNLRDGRATPAETLRIVIRATKRRLLRRLNGAAF